MTKMQERVAIVIISLTSISKNYSISTLASNTIMPINKILTTKAKHPQLGTITKTGWTKSNSSSFCRK